jgi:cellobiose phosphorylase
MIAGLFLYAAREMEQLFAWLARPDAAQRMGGHYREMLHAVETEAWDGQWYLRAFDAESRPVGSAKCDEGKIFIESQGWCVLGGAGRDNGRALQALQSVHEHLFTPNGIILQQPAYSAYHLELGEITSYPPGVKENAGIFCHNNAWIHLALCQTGQGERALEYYLSICPSAKERQIETYRSEPYVYAQMIAGRDASCFGEAKNSWLTGTAAWTFVSVSQGLLGVQPDYEGLLIDPCIPKDWTEYKVTRRFRGVEYKITINNPDGVNRGVKCMTVDGKTVDGNRIPLFETGPVEVEVELGKALVRLPA